MYIYTVDFNFKFELESGDKQCKVGSPYFGPVQRSKFSCAFNEPLAHKFIDLDFGLSYFLGSLVVNIYLEKPNSFGGLGDVIFFLGGGRTKK